MQLVTEVEAVEGTGLRGDRYFNGEGTFSKDENSDNQVTLIESEAVAAAVAAYDLNITPAQTRRNLVTEGVALNHLVGKTFTVGEVTLRGVRLAEPCGYLEKLTVPDIRRSLIHRGGLRATIVSSGTIRTGDPITT